MTLAVGINDVHALEQRCKLGMLVVLLEDLVEILLVHDLQTILGRQPVTQTHSTSARASLGEWLNTLQDVLHEIVPVDDVLGDVVYRISQEEPIAVAEQ